MNQALFHAISSPGPRAVSDEIVRPPCGRDLVAPRAPRTSLIGLPPHTAVDFGNAWAKERRPLASAHTKAHRRQECRRYPCVPPNRVVLAIANSPSRQLSIVFLLHQQHPLHIHKLAGLEAVIIHVAWQTARVPSHCVHAGLLHLVQKRRHFATKHVVDS